jgi:hypothetical protein
MNVQAPASTLAETLRQVAMVAELSTSCVGMTRTDKGASRQADQQHAATDGASKVVVNRFAGADELIRQIKDVQTEAANVLKANTSIWGKRRLLPNANFQRWIGRHTAIKDQFDLLVAEVRNQADAIIAESTRNVGTFNIAPPTRKELEEAFSLKYNLEPIPDPSAFGAIMGDDGQLIAEADQHLRWQFEENMLAAVNSAKLDAAERLAKPLTNLVERMEAYNLREKEIAHGKAVGKEGYFRDTIITNVQDIAEVFGNLNVLGDPTMEEINQKLKPFMQITPDILRSNEQIRAAAMRRAADIIKDLDGMMTR